MRVVFLTQYFPPEIGAPQTRLSAVARELVRHGHEVEVVTAMPNHPRGEVFPGYRGRVYLRETWEGVPVHRVAIYPSLGGGARRALNYLSFAATAFLGLARCRRPDLVFVESPPPTLAVTARVACGIWGCPFLFNVADLWPDSLTEMGFLKEGAALRAALGLERWTYREAALVNAVTEGIRDRLKEKGVPDSKIVFLPNGVDTQLFRPRAPDAEMAKRLGADGRRVILYAGTIGYAQGLDVALDAAERLSSRADLLLAFVGDGSDKARLVEEARRRKLTNVVFVEPVSQADVARMWSVALAGLATLKALPLFDGARPSKIFPVMASGRPILYSGRGEGARLIEEARAGLVAAPEDGVALAEAIRRLLDDPALADELGANGRRFVEAHLAWGPLVAAWVEEVKAKGGAALARAGP